MPFRRQPMELVASPPRYPQPDWDGIGQVTRLWVPDDETVGWLIRQNDDRLAWLSASGPDDLGYHNRRNVGALLREGAPAGTPVGEVCTEALTNAFSTTPQDLYLPALLADIRKAWAPA